MTLHYILVVLIIIVIIGAQLYIYKNTKIKYPHTNPYFQHPHLHIL